METPPRRDAAPPVLGRAVPALVDLDRGAAFDVAEVDGRVERLARALASRRARGLGLVIAHSSVPSVVAHLALLRAGWVSMLVPAASRPESLAHWRARYAPDVTVDDARGAPEDESGTVGGVRAVFSDRDERDIPAGCAALLPTSGSTGSPRFVRLAPSALDANAEAIASALAIAPDDVGLLPIPLAFAYGLSVLHSHAVRGATVALTARSFAERSLWPAAAAAGVTSIPGVPYGYQLLRRTGFLRLELPSLRAMTQAGGRLDPALTREFLDALEPRGVRLYTMYGQSEATARIAIVPPELARAKLGSAGRPVPGTAVTVEGGRVVVRGPSVMLGYAEERGDLARGDDLRGVLDTGDVGSVDADGFLWISGRASRFSKVFGVRVSLDDLESSLDRFGPAAVVERAEKLVAVLEAPVDAQAILEHFAVRFGIQPMNVRVRVGEALPRLPSGKVAYGDIT
jgi:acyl-CoA synthetase (AMP-forming)/AMP-acid ligase II